MPLFLDDSQDQGPQAVVEGSIAVELDWALAAALTPEFRRDHPVLARVYGQQPSLSQRYNTFWGKGEKTACGGAIELIVLAHHGGLLDCLDSDQLFSRLEDICADAPTELSLASENDHDRAALLARLAHLRGSASHRQNYVALVADVWSALAGDWEQDGRPAVRASVAERRELVRKGASWRDVSRGRCHQDLCDKLVADQGPGGVVTIVPAFYAHLGSVVQLPGTVLIGVRADSSGHQARARTADLARRLKAVSDPTRLAMIEALRWSPLTVNQLAARFGLAQPTVSNHVKVLTDAGVVSRQVDGGQRRLVLDQDTLNDLLDRLGDVFAYPKKT